MRHRARPLAAITVLGLMVAACGEGGTPVPTETTRAPSATTTSAGLSATTATTAPSGGGEGSVTVTIDGTTYELSTRDDIPIGFGSVKVPTRCEPNFFGRGQFWVIAVAIDENGEQTNPQVSLEMNLFATAQDAEDAGENLEFKLSVMPSEGSPSEELEYIIANAESLTVQSIIFEGELGSWTIEGNRIYGEVAVYEYDHVGEFFTASFDVTCPD